MTGKAYTLPFYEQILDFLASAPTLQEIINFRPPPAAQRRFDELLQMNRQGSLTLQEQEELDHYIGVERMLSLLKAKAYGRLGYNGG